MTDRAGSADTGVREPRDWPTELREWAAMELPATEAFLLEAATAFEALVTAARNLRSQLYVPGKSYNQAKYEAEQELDKVLAALGEAEPTASEGTTQGQTKATYSTGTYAGGSVAGEADND